MENSNKIKSYRDLIVWQKSMELVRKVYDLTSKFPREEIFGLVNQMRRATVSIPSNIADGRARGYRKEYRQFLLNAFGSGAELETQIEISKTLPKTKDLNYSEIDALLNEVMRMLNSLISKLKS